MNTMLGRAMRGSRLSLGRGGVDGDDPVVLELADAVADVVLDVGDDTQVLDVVDAKVLTRVDARGADPRALYRGWAHAAARRGR